MEPAEKDCRAHPGSNPKPATTVNQQHEEAMHAAKEGHAPHQVLLLTTSSNSHRHSKSQDDAPAEQDDRARLGSSPKPASAVLNWSI